MHREIPAAGPNPRKIEIAGQRLVRYIFKSLLSLHTEIASDGKTTSAPELSDKIELRLPSLYWTIRILLRPDLMVGQAYVDGHWSVQPEKLFDFLYLLRSQDSSRLQNWFLLSNRFHVVRDTLKQRLFPIRSTRAVAEHYNTDPFFMSFILGESLSYTCAFFDNLASSLDDAQASKLRLIAQRVSLQRGHTVLDLGTGWGYAPLPLAEKYGCDVTGITISEAQVGFCNTRRGRSALSDKMTFLLADYATYKPPYPFDRVISIGMIEHVGKFQYTQFFDRIADFLRDDGLALIHGMIEEEETSPDAWIDKNIFPGGYIPTASEIVRGIERSNCELVQVFTHETFHYFRTLESWKENLFNNRSQCEARLREIGLAQRDSGRIIRIWEYFLSASQIAFSKCGRCRTAHFIVRRKTR